VDFIHIEVPVQLQLKHRGGQISDYPQRMESFINIAAGLRANFDLGEKRYGQMGIEYLHFYNKEREGDTISGISHGNASWIRFHYAYKAFRFESGYWQAHDFYAPNGNPIFGCVSDYKPGIVIHDRQIINNSFSVRFLPISSLEFFFGVDLYYDINLKRMDQAYTIHLNFDKLLNLLTSKHTVKEHLE
jgi:hypothetical protein